jgi:hypothetical protein
MIPSKSKLDQFESKNQKEMNHSIGSQNIVSEDTPVKKKIKNNLPKKITVLVYLGIILYLVFRFFNDPFENDSSSGFRGLVPFLSGFLIFLLLIVAFFSLIVFGTIKLFRKDKRTKI